MNFVIFPKISFFLKVSQNHFSDPLYEHTFICTKPRILIVVVVTFSTHTERGNTNRTTGKNKNVVISATSKCIFAVVFISTFFHGFAAAAVVVVAAVYGFSLSIFIQCFFLTKPTTMLDCFFFSGTCVDMKCVYAWRFGFDVGMCVCVRSRKKNRK